MIKRVQIPERLWGSYFIKRPPEEAAEKKVILLLHGYSEAGEYFYNKLKDHIPQDVTVVSPDGPFFVPVQTDNGYRAGHSWYFYDPRTDEYIVDMKLARQYISEIFKVEELLKHPESALTIVGYSQGGYLAPFIGLDHPQAHRVIGLSCQFLVDEFESLPSFQMTAIHGIKDDVVEIAGAEKSIEKLKDKFASATMIEVPGAGHRLDSRILDALKNCFGSK